MGYYMMTPSIGGDYAELLSVKPQKLDLIYEYIVNGYPIPSDFSEEIEWSLSKRKSSGRKIGDLVSNSNGLMIVSDKIREFLTNKTEPKYQFYPIIIRDADEQVIHKKYWIANLLKSISCADTEKSEFMQRADRQWDHIIKLAIDEDKIPKGTTIFRFEECRRIWLMEEHLATEFHQNGGFKGYCFFQVDSIDDSLARSLGYAKGLHTNQVETINNSKAIVKNECYERFKNNNEFELLSGSLIKGIPYVSDGLSLSFDKNIINRANSWLRETAEYSNSNHLKILCGTKWADGTEECEVFFVIDRSVRDYPIFVYSESSLHLYCKSFDEFISRLCDTEENS